MHSFCTYHSRRTLMKSFVTDWSRLLFISAISTMFCDEYFPQRELINNFITAASTRERVISTSFVSRFFQNSGPNGWAEWNPRVARILNMVHSASSSTLYWLTTFAVSAGNTCSTDSLSCSSSGRSWRTSARLQTGTFCRPSWRIRSPSPIIVKFVSQNKFWCMQVEMSAKNNKDIKTSSPIKTDNCRYFRSGAFSWDAVSSTVSSVLTP